MASMGIKRTTIVEAKSKKQTLPAHRKRQQSQITESRLNKTMVSTKVEDQATLNTSNIINADMTALNMTVDPKDAQTINSELDQPTDI